MYDLPVTEMVSLVKEKDRVDYEAAAAQGQGEEQA